jgi:diguanylate cyclase (GGDEF)-like protein
VPSARVLQIADRIVKLFAQRIATLAMPVNVTLSAGVASLRDTGSKCAAALLARADEALYAAKAAGKNMARCAAAVRSGPPEKPPPRVRS